MDQKSDEILKAEGEMTLAAYEELTVANSELGSAIRDWGVGINRGIEFEADFDVAPLFDRVLRCRSVLQRIVTEISYQRPYKKTREISI